VSAVKEKLMSRKFWAVMVATVWWLVCGTLGGAWEELGWKIVALILGYLVAEGGADLVKFFRSNGQGE